MNGKQLKNSILQWAIQGRLVPQDPNDEPAAVLLEKIRAEKERLVKEGKLKKKDLEVKPIAEDEVPFEIPKGWEWSRIKEVFSMQAGKFVSASDISAEQTGDYVYPCYGGNGLRGYVKKFNNEGHFTLVGRQGALCGNVQVANGKFYATEHAVVTDGFGQTNVRWAYYFLTALNLNQYATATAQPGLAVSNILEVLLPLPPLAEQHRIVAKIEELMPLVEKYGEAQEALDEWNKALPEKLKKSILQEAIQGRLVPQDPSDEPASALLERVREEKKRLVKEGKLKKKDLEVKPIEEEEIPFEIPESWEWVKLQEVIGLLSGQDLVPQRYSSDKQGIPYITGASCFNNGNLELNRWTTSPTSVSHKGDLLVTCKGTVGTMAFNSIGDMHIARQIMAISSFGVFMPYLKYFMEYIVPDLEKKAHSIIPGISREDLLNCLFPLPPHAEQHRIVEKIEELFGVIT